MFRALDLSFKLKLKNAFNHVDLVIKSIWKHRTTVMTTKGQILDGGIEPSQKFYFER